MSRKPQVKLKLEIKADSVDDLTTVPGITEPLAQAIKAGL